MIIQFLSSAEYNVSETFGSNNILYNLLKDDSVEQTQLSAILNVIHSRIDSSNEAMIIVNDLIFGENEWLCER